ncbi:MAG: hypothetical protein ACOX0W_04100 [Sphaerochaetaceae bacterium]|jgi:hypothetical protein
MRYVTCVLILLFAFSGVSCDTNRTITISISESHPWERASGRVFWYTFVYPEGDELMKINLPIGVREITINRPKLHSFVCAAYPLGEGIPFGGAYVLPQQKSVELHLQEGPLVEALLHTSKKWSRVVSQVNYNQLKELVKNVDHTMIALQWNALVKDIVDGKLKESSVKAGNRNKVVIEELPPGKWVSETDAVPSFTAFMDHEVTMENLPSGMIRFLHVEQNMELRIIVPEESNEEVFWHITTVDPLLLLSDSLYYELLYGRK